MSLSLLGTGWVTPLGNGLDEVWERLAAGVPAAAQAFPARYGQQDRYYLPVGPKQVEALNRTPRIRRSSSITYFSAAAGLAALKDAGLAMNPELASRTAIVFAIASGGVLYTRRFYKTVVFDGPQAASPLLFPETVYNAPASHLAAIMGVDSASYTLVGDATVGVSALAFADELLACNPNLDQCVVVGAEECDWILCEAYISWRLLAATPQVRLGIHGRPSGMLLSEGATALVVGRSGDSGEGAGSGELQIKAAAAPFTKQAMAGRALRSALEGLPVAGSQLAIGSANGTWVDRAEAKELAFALPETPVFYPKPVLGESLGAASLLQVALAGQCIRRGSVPRPASAGGDKEAPPATALERVTVTSIGLNGEAGGAVISKPKACIRRG